MEIEEKSKKYLEKQKKNSSYHFIEGIKACIPTIFGYLSIGFACGILSKSCGLTFGEALGMSIFVYAGSAQFIAASMILSNESVVSIIATIFFVNFRHLFMSAALAPYFKKNSLLKNLSTGILLTDETFLVAAAEGFNKKKINYFWMLGLNITAYLNWAIATGIGVMLGSIIPDYKVFGLDFALTAMFIGLLISSIKGSLKVNKAIIIIITSIITLILSTKIIGTSAGIIIAAIAGALIGVVIKE